MERSPADKYDNLRIGLNSRLDTIQAAVLKVKLQAFKDHELESVNCAAKLYDEYLGNVVKTPVVPEGFYSSWAQYTLILDSKEQRTHLQKELKNREFRPWFIIQNRCIFRGHLQTWDTRKGISQ